MACVWTVLLAKWPLLFDMVYRLSRLANVVSQWVSLAIGVLQQHQRTHWGSQFLCGQIFRGSHVAIACECFGADRIWYSLLALVQVSQNELLKLLPAERLDLVGVQSSTWQALLPDCAGTVVCGLGPCLRKLCLGWLGDEA